MLPFTTLTEPDNTNADPNTRAVWVALAQKLKVPLRCVLFTASPKLCEHNDTFRALNVGPEVSCMAAILSAAAGVNDFSRLLETCGGTILKRKLMRVRMKSAPVP